MFECRMCRKTTPDELRSKAHKTLCSECYSNIVRYKRYKKMGSTAMKHQIFIRRLEAMFVINEIDGWYVPKIFYKR